VPCLLRLLGGESAPAVAHLETQGGRSELDVDLDPTRGGVLHGLDDGLTPDPERGVVVFAFERCLRRWRRR
jgi:hypothetical protein